MSTVAEAICCSKCRKVPAKEKFRKDGTPGLPFRWVRRDGAIFCQECKPKMLTRNWSYDVRIVDEASQVLIDEQMKRAHRYRNDLCALEQSRRAKVEQVLKDQWPELVALETELATTDARVEEIRSAIGKKNAEDKKKGRGTAEQQEQLKELREKRRGLWAQRKSLRETAFASPATIAANRAVEEWALAELKRLRASCGLYWSTYSLVEQAAVSFRSGAPPKFLSWRGDGHIAVQIQGGLPVADAFGGHKQFQIRVEAGEPAQSGPMATAWLRVGSDQNSKPIWARVRFRMHRPLPEGVSIKWVHLTRVRVATHSKFKLVLAIEGPPGGSLVKTDGSDEGSVGIDVGWRLMDDGRLRLAYWMADRPLKYADIRFDGALAKSVILKGDGTEGELRLNDEVVERWKLCEHIDGVRRLLFNQMLAKLSVWLQGNQSIIPDWLKERTETLDQWKSENRLASLVLFWRDNRFEGDAAFFGDWDRWQEVRRTRGNEEYHALVKMLANDGILHAWQIQDRHLYDYQEGLRQRAMRHRDHLLRVFAAVMRRHYRTVLVEDVNWRDEILKYKPVESDTSLGIEKLYHRMAAPGRLIKYLGESVGTLRKNPKLTTKRCFECKKVCEFDASKSVEHECEHCGIKFDIDANAACWLLSGDAETGG